MGRRIAKAELLAGTLNTISYDGDGKRRSLEDSSMLRNFLWDGQNISYQTGSDGSVNRNYTYKPSMYACPERSRGRELIPARRPAGKSQSGAFHHGVHPERSRRDGLGCTARRPGSRCLCAFPAGQACHGAR